MLEAERLKPGKTVWIFEDSKPIPVKLITFDRGSSAEVEYIDPPKKGRRQIVLKAVLYAKKPAGYRQ